jgi:hypothetical protein
MSLTPSGTWSHLLQITRILVLQILFLPPATFYRVGPNVSLSILFPITHSLPSSFKSREKDVHLIKCESTVTCVSNTLCDMLKGKTEYKPKALCI